MELRGDAKLLRIFIGEQDKYENRSLYEKIVVMARDAGLAGATVMKGVFSYGASSRIHTAKIFDFSQDMPMIVELVDTEEKISGFIPTLDEVLEHSGSGALITIESVEIIK
ncbi:MAG: DUF190 domain-containing protein, partial [Chlorobiales bacterium]|nr:DUF190 domain-containing protein [Chlorobiales bacterium]